VFRYPIGIGLVVAVVAGAILLHSGSKPSRRAAPRGTVTIGVLAPLSGSLADRGRDLAAGASMAAVEINARGGVLGRRLVLSVEDDECAPDAAATASQRLAAKHVAGVVGGACEDAARAELDAADAAHTPLLVTSADADTLVGNPFGFLFTGTVYQEALAAEHWIGYRTPQRVAVVDDATPQSRELAEEVRRRVRLDLPTRLMTAGDAESARAVAAAALRSHPDLVYWSGGAAPGGRLVQALRAAGYRGTFLASAACDSPAFLDAAGEKAAQGAYVTTTASPQLLRTAAKWSVRYRAAYERAPGRDAMQAYDAVRALAQAIRQGRSARGDEVAKSLSGLRDFSTFLGALRFSPDHSMTDDDHVIAVVDDGAFKLANILRTD
jgi:branched-chain amino acid transport system substrate-binding protein